MSDRLINLAAAYQGELFSLGYRVIIAVIIIIAGKVLMGIAAKLLTLSKGTFQADETLLSLLRVIIKYALIIVCLIMILNVFGINTTALVALLGTAGVAVGLALKDTLGNIASGVMLILLQSYHKGDFIEFGSFMGTVRNFDLFTTTLETPDGVFISAPNSAIWAAPVKNYSKNTKRRMDLAIGISYYDSLDTAYRVMQEIVNAEPRFLTDPKPQIMIQSLGDSSVNILLRAWAPSDVYWEIYWKHVRLIKEKIQEAGLSIPFPQRDIRVIEEKKSPISMQNL
ncbi:MAG: mechanosensitive ion channel family protein [Treponema sp.]|jgi:small conductance mechanosensitive channel|nr:mechanosensitive ion channel family protein [Treponema sp.]